MGEKSCYSLRCGYVTSDPVDACPKCGRRMRSAGQIRFLGGIQLLLGVFLAGFMGVITYNLAPLLLNPSRPEGGSRFTGTSQQAVLILGLFGLIIIFGLGSSLTGIWQIATGRRNKWIILIVLVFGVGLLLIGVVINQTFVR